MNECTLKSNSITLWCVTCEHRYIPKILVINHYLFRSGQANRKENAANSGKMDIQSVTEIDFSLERCEYTKINSGLFHLIALRKMFPYRTLELWDISFPSCKFTA